MKKTVLLMLIGLVCICPGQDIRKKKDHADFGLAQSLSSLGKFEEATEKLQRLHSIYPENRRVMIELAKALGYSKKLDRSVVLLDKLEARYPNDKDIKRLYATIYESNQEFEKSRTYYVYLLEQDPSDKKLMMKIGDISSWTGDYPTSIKYYDQILATEPENAKLRTKLGDLNLWSGNYEEAAHHYSNLDLDPKEDKVRFRDLGYCYLNLEQFDDAIAIFHALSVQYPTDIDSKIALANLYYASGEIDKAGEEFEKIIAQNPEDIESAAKLAEILASKEYYSEALKIFEKILSMEPDNKTALLWSARIYSWDRQYDNAESLYDKIIEDDPDWLIPRREKARTLGWARKYDESISEYQRTIDEIPDSKATSEEKQAKYHSYNHFPSGAIKYYNKWLESEPESLEAIFDLGQEYCRQMQWNNANKMFKRTLDIFPGHYRAEQARRKSYINSQLSKVKIGFEYIDADSGSRDIDQRYWRTFASVRKPLNENYYITAGQSNTWYSFKGHKQIYAQGFSGILEYFNKPDFHASVNYTNNIFSDKTGVRNTFGGEANFKPQDRWKWTVLHQREAILDNGVTFNDGLYRDNYKVRGLHSPNRRIAFGADYMYSRYSDRNNRNAYGFDLGYYLHYEPKSLKVTYRYEEYRFNTSRSSYFTPNSFHYNTIGLEWRHFLNKAELFWGSNDTYYTVRYAVNFDVKDEVGHNIYFDFHHDLTDKVIAHMEWSEIIYEHSNVYEQSRLMFYISFHI